MKKNFEKIAPHIYSFVKKKVDLSEFLSTEIGCNLRWYEDKISAGTVCPLPNHKDNKPSFRIKFMENNGLWAFHCLGCGAKGTIIEFCKEYYGLNSAAESVLFICKKFGFNQSDINIADSVKGVQRRVNLQKRIACAHVVTSRQCLVLLTKDYQKYNKWVANVYKLMNKALDEEDLATIEQIGFEASNKIQEQG